MMVHVCLSTICAKSMTVKESALLAIQDTLYNKMGNVGLALVKNQLISAAGLGTGQKESAMNAHKIGTILKEKAAYKLTNLVQQLI